MTSITVIIEEQRITAFTCNGHAGYAKASEDIVCAAISMLVINMINSIELIVLITNIEIAAHTISSDALAYPACPLQVNAVIRFLSFITVILVISNNLLI